MPDTQEVRRVTVGSYARRQKYREWALFGTIGLLFLGLVALLAIIVRLEAQASQLSSPLYRSDAELVAGGKRFIDAFYSLNAATVEHDQFRAIRMMVDPADREKRLRYLTQTDLVRNVRSAGTSSRIRWKGATSKVRKKHDNGVVTIEYKAQLVIDQRNAHPLNILLDVVPVEKTDENTDGVGVVEWTDVAKTPFAQGEDT